MGSCRNLFSLSCDLLAVVTALTSPPFNEWLQAAGAIMTEVTLREGEILWLPAGWFHEVTSASASASASTSTAAGGDAGGGGGAADAGRGGAGTGHMAMNYWFHPPDTAHFEQPYSGEFWPYDWSKRGN